MQLLAAGRRGPLPPLTSEGLIGPMCDWEAPSVALESAPRHARFDVRRRLGAGGQGVVFAAWDREREVEVALKTLFASTPSARRRLKREFRLVADLVHDRLVPLHELFVDDTSCFFTMDLVPDAVDVVRFVRGEVGALRVSHETTAGTGTVSGTRRAPTTVDATFDEARLRGALEQMLDGLGALHERGLCHRDLKPSNVLVRPDGRLSILDYGLVVAEAERSEGFEGFEGTAAYAAPEQADGRAGSEVDAYALGVVLFEAITGTLPFRGSSLQILVDKRQREAPSLDTLCAGVPADLVALVGKLLARDPARRRATVGARRAAPRPLFGREAELTAIDDAFRVGGRVVVVEGPSGIGKSSLVRAFVARARAAGATVLEGRCNPREQVPYNALDGVMDALSSALRARGVEAPGAAARLFPVLGMPEADAGHDPDAVRRRAYDELRELLTVLPRPILFVDDFQWADPDSRELVTELAKGAVTIVLAQRGGGGPLPWAARVLPLGPLPEAGARALLDHARGERPIAVDELIVLGAGHPMFLEELARAAVPTAPTDLAAALSARLASLAAPARRLVALASLTAAPLPAYRLVRALPEVAPADAFRTIDVLRAERLLRLTDRGVAPFHDRVAEAALASLAPDEIAAMHRALAAALRDGGDAASLVYHLAAAGDRAAARDGALAAASRAESVLAFDQAASLLRDARRHGEDDDALRYRLADALANAHRGVEAAEVYLTVGGPRRSRARVRAAELLLASGEIARGRDVVAALLAEIDRPLPATPVGALGALVAERVLLRARGLELRRRAVDPDAAERNDLLRGVALGLGMADNLRAAAYNARALRGALDLGDPIRAAIALATAAIFEGSVDARRPRVELARARAIHEATHDETAAAWIAGAEATLDALALDGPEVLAGLDQAMRYFALRTRGNGWAVSSMRLVRGLTKLLLGRIEELRAELPVDLADARLRGDRYLETTLRRGATRVHLCDGDVEAARAALDERAWAPASEGFHIQHWLWLEGRAEIALYEGDASRVLDEHAGLFRALRLSLVGRLQRPRILARSTRGKLLLARARARGDRAALAECALLVRLLSAEGVGYATARSALLAAGLAAVRRDDDGRLRALERAVAVADRHGLALTAAAARLRLGELVGGDRGRACLAEARAWFAAERVVDPERVVAVEVGFA